MIRRLINFIKGFFSSAISDLERSNPRAMLEAEREEFQNRLINFNDKLAHHAALTSRLMKQIYELEQKEKELTELVELNLNKGERRRAGELVLKLKDIQKRLGDSREKVEQFRATYKELLRTREDAVKHYKQKVEEIRDKITETEMREAQAEMTQMASDVSKISGGEFDALNRLDEYLEERKARADGRIQIAREQSVAPEDYTEEEKAMLAEKALREFETQMDAKEKIPKVEHDVPHREDGTEEQESRKELGPEI